MQAQGRSGRLNVVVERNGASHLYWKFKSLHHSASLLKKGARSWPILKGALWRLKRHLRRNGMCSSGRFAAIS